MRNKRTIIVNVNRNLGKTYNEEKLIKSIIGEDLVNLAIVKHSTCGLIQGEPIKIIDTKKRGPLYSVIAQDMRGRTLKVPSKYIKGINVATDTKSEIARTISKVNNSVFVDVVSKAESRIPPHHPGPRPPKPHRK